MRRIFFFVRVSCRLGIPSQWKSLTVFKKWLQFITAIIPALCLALFCFHPCSVCFVFLLHSRAEFELSYIHVFHFSWVLKKDWLISLMSHAERLHLLYNNSTEVSCTCPNIMTVSWKNRSRSLKIAASSCLFPASCRWHESVEENLYWLSWDLISGEKSVRVNGVSVAFQNALPSDSGLDWFPVSSE